MDFRRALSRNRRPLDTIDRNGDHRVSFGRKGECPSHCELPVAERFDCSLMALISIPVAVAVAVINLSPVDRRFVVACIGP